MACLFEGEEHQVLQVSQENSERVVYVGSQPAKSMRFAWFSECHPTLWRQVQGWSLFVCVGGGGTQGYFQARNNTKCLLHQETS